MRIANDVVIYVAACIIKLDILMKNREYIKWQLYIRSYTWALLASHLKFGTYIRRL